MISLSGKEVVLIIHQDGRGKNLPFCCGVPANLEHFGKLWLPRCFMLARSLQKDKPLAVSEEIALNKDST
jgi:hypothetical protein